MTKKSFLEFADVFFVSDDDSLDLGHQVPSTVEPVPSSIDHKSVDHFDILEGDQSDTPSSMENWSLRDRKLQLTHLETTIKHLKADILIEHDIFGLTTNGLGKAIKILDLTNEWIPICSDDLNCVNFAVYLVEANAYVQSLINPSLSFEEMLALTNPNQERAELWRELQAERDHIALLFKTESEHSLEQKEQLRNLIDSLDRKCDYNLSIFSNNEKLCELIKKLKDENLAFFSRLEDFQRVKSN